jgi:hypothetical protein
VSRLGGRGDILMALEAGMTVVDVSVTHTPSSTTRTAAAQTKGTAAGKRDEAKCQACNCLEPHGYHFVPFTVDSYGRQGKPALRLLARLSSRGVSRGSRQVWLCGRGHPDDKCRNVQGQCSRLPRWWWAPGWHSRLGFSPRQIGRQMR